MTVGSVLAAPGLGLRSLHICRAEADVRWVATSELADPAPFLEGGEILLTTGIETRQWRHEWDEYVHRLAEAHVAAVGMGAGLTHAKTPAGLVNACRKHGVNVFEVPRRTAFVAISRHTAQLLEEQESTDAREALKVQRRLIAAAAKPDPTVAVVSTLAQAVNGAACLMSPDGRVTVGPVGPRRADFPLDEVAVDVVRLQAHGRRSASVQSRPTASVSVHPIGLRGRPSTYLAVLGPTRLSDGQRHAVTTAVAVLGLVDEQDRSRARTRRHLRARAIELLIGNDAETAQLVLDVDLPTSVLPPRFRILRAAGEESQVDDALTGLEHRGVLAGNLSGELCAVLELRRAQGVGAALADAGLLVGVGDVVPAGDGAGGHRTAGLALDQATTTSGPVFWDRVIGDGPLGLIDPQRASAFAESWLRNLDSEQLDTLHCFLRHHGSRLKVAEELGLHRNTVRNRLDSIEAVLPGQLDDPQTRVSAWIALQSLRAR
ncbi:PucR family transcriptional regulator [Mycobacterium sp. 21AC1]|uniref:PucR family transcriptional regulator n=1 Tax=[Mycobacterium] appelbergii TaxID=2939269 RepID=UPI0029391E04|nr:PucR family transcriptional regulator [Mycobacterium sp. 21AC1]MDV3125800.1 PucR family transcriptional regulator [Mycobacterium sp. 21AC1]